MTEIKFRSIRPEEFPEFYQCMVAAFEQKPHAAEMRADAEVLEPERTLAAFDNGRIVATALAYSRIMAIPGGLLSTACVSYVAVLPSHRERGLLGRIMMQQLRGLRDHGGESVAALFPSQGGLYGRYGYGPAAPWTSFSIPADKLRFQPQASVRVDLVDDMCEMPPEVEGIYSELVPAMPGWFHRTPQWWSRRIFDPAFARGNASAFRYALYGAASGKASGYAIYRLVPRGAEIFELSATDPTGYLSLWAYIAALEGVEVIQRRTGPPDEPMIHALSDPMSFTMSPQYAMWLRLVDLKLAMEQRAYDAEVEVVLNVSDAACPWNSGRWRLSVGPSGAECVPTSHDAHLNISAPDLAAAYLGGVSLLNRASAGMVEEIRPGSIAALSRSMRSDRAPWCPEGF